MQIKYYFICNTTIQKSGKTCACLKEFLKKNKTQEKVLEVLADWACNVSC